MKGERYSIEVSDSEVLIHGYLSIREIFDFINFYDQDGYNSIIPGYENSCLRMIKKKHIEKKECCDEIDRKLPKNLIIPEV